LAQRECDRVQRSGCRLKAVDSDTGRPARGQTLLVRVPRALCRGQLVVVSVGQGLQRGGVPLELLEYDRVPSGDVLFSGDRVVEGGTGLPLRLDQVRAPGRFVVVSRR